MIASQCRRLWSAIHLDTSMRPVQADWRVKPPAPDDGRADATYRPEPGTPEYDRLLPAKRAIERGRVRR